MVSAAYTQPSVHVYLDKSILSLPSQDISTHIIIFDGDELCNPIFNILKIYLNVSIGILYNIFLSFNLFDNYTYRIIEVKINYLLLDFNLKLYKIRNIPYIIQRI